MPEIQPGQIYSSLSNRHHPCDGPTRILIKSWAPYGAGHYGAGKAWVVTLSRSGKELRGRHVSLDQLHASPFTRDGQPRRTGYALETPRIGDPRRDTPDVITTHPNGITSTRVTLKRCCNGCGSELGDVDSRDLTWGGQLADVTSECPTCTPSLKGTPDV